MSKNKILKDVMLFVVAVIILSFLMRGLRTQPEKHEGGDQKDTVYVFDSSGLTTHIYPSTDSLIVIEPQ